MLSLFLIFLQIGTFTLGGGLSMLGMIERELVKKRHWIEEQEFWDFVALIQVIPGVFAVNLALYFGYKLKGWRGAAISALGAVLPSILIIILVAAFFNNIRDNEIVIAIFKGVRPAVVALIAYSAIKLWKSMKRSALNLLIPLVSLALILFLKISPVYLVIFAIAGGISYGIIIMKTVSKSQKPRKP
ncbi:MAG: chromate transporter [Bacteroidales bacterium]|jgi:chromate transporter|nr:chromate transporter [Bacteroidales bacterium]